MANVELVIKISEEDYKSIKDDVKNFLSMPSHKVPVLYEAVDKGIQLPKGHGDLKDEDNLKLSFVKWDMVVQDCFSYSDIDTIVHYSPTIIEADKKGENE